MLDQYYNQFLYDFIQKYPNITPEEVEEQARLPPAVGLPNLISKIPKTELNQCKVYPKKKYRQRIDLHGFSLQSGKEVINRVFLNSDFDSPASIEIVTGRGIHSLNSSSHLKDQIPQHSNFSFHAVPYENDKNDGSFLIEWDSGGINSFPK